MSGDQCLRLLNSELLSCFSGVMQVSTFAITIRGFAPKICPHPGAFASYLLPGGREFVGVAPEGGHLSINDFLPLLEFLL